MKDQYFGDRTDYIKHSLMRWLSGGKLNLAVHWNRTPDDGTNDGKHTTYLSDPARWRKFDRDVFDRIQESVNSDDRRLSHFETYGLIENATFCYDEWTRCPEQRKRSNQRFVGCLGESSLIFYDPDNGIETKSVNPKSENSRKYIYYDDIDFAWSKNHSLMLYQHYPRVSRGEYLDRMLSEISGRLDVSTTMYAISTSFAAFLFALQPQHQKSASEIITAFSKHWSPHITLYRKSENAAIQSIEICEFQKNEQIELPL